MNLRSVLRQAAVADCVVGLAIFFVAGPLQRLLGICNRGEPAFFRLVGAFLLFAAYLYLLAYRDEERRIFLAQATLALRVALIVLLLVQVIFLLGPGAGRLRLALLLAALGEIYFATLQGRALTQLGRAWFTLGEQ